MKSPWITYRTRFLIKAKQLSTSLTFVDFLGRHHSGRKGDYLVESADGVLSIAPRQIFEDIYVPLQAGETPAQEDTMKENTQQPSPEPQYANTSENQTLRQSETKRQREIPKLPLHLTRKSPQPDRDRRPSQGLRSL
jgi:hypothetical protein